MSSSHAASTREPRLVLGYDGVCGLCNGAVQFVLARDKRWTMCFAPLQGAYMAAVRQRHPGSAGVDSFVCVAGDEQSGESVAVRSDAVIMVARYLGGVWRVLGALLSVVPRFLRDAGYDLVARTRYRVFGRYDVCPLPTPEQRARFIL
jgi:predicted DCC family thiol-disulfide oxidoreductase YuxK